MMKFKSLFRRGHAGSSSSTVKRPLRGENSSSHIGVSAVSNNNESLMRPAASVCSLDTKHHKINSLSPQKRKPRPSGVAADSNSLKKMDDDAFKIQREQAAQDKKTELEEELVRCQCEIETLRMELAKMKKEHSKDEAAVQSSSQSQLNEDAYKEQHQLIGLNVTSNSAACTMLPTQQQLPLDPVETPDWDKHSSSSLSEVSVACLQDRIMQMEETHYSTNEELQATLQELADLQTQLTELQTDNERLGEEKGVLLESLCRQTERLEDARTKVDTLQGLLLENPAGCPASSSEREQKLVELLKSGQEEREALLLKQEELGNEVSELRRVGEMMRQESLRLTERVRLLESTVDATHAERNQLDLELARAKEESSSRQIEISRLTTLLDNARAKIDELEAARDKLGDKSELDELLDNARKEKDLLEVQAASLQEQLARSQCEVAKLKEQVSILQEECKVTRNNAKSALSDLEYECQKGREERGRLAADLQALQETSSELQVQSQCHLDDKRQLESLLTETQKHLGECARSLANTEKLLAEEKNLRTKENEEWEQFQSDLLMTVRVANEFKTEAQHELERLVIENKQLRDKNRTLNAQLEKLKFTAEKPQVVSENSAAMLSLRCEVSQEMCRRHKISRQDSRLSVKSLIESIENATKQAKTGSAVSRSSSTSSISSIASMSGCLGTAVTSSVTTGQQQPPTASTPTSPLCDTEFKTPLPLRDRDQQLGGNKHQLKRTLLSDTLDTVKGNKSAGAEDSAATILSSRGMEFARRNSCNDLSERKDPLSALVKNGGSKRNALLKWCQTKTVGYRNIDITNFSSSWNDGMALCALLHSYLPDKVPYDSLIPSEKKRNFTIAFAAAESVGIPTALSITDMIQQERPDWQHVMGYITAIYKHFETGHVKECCIRSKKRKVRAEISSPEHSH